MRNTLGGPGGAGKTVSSYIPLMEYYRHNCHCSFLNRAFHPTNQCTGSTSLDEAKPRLPVLGARHSNPLCSCIWHTDTIKGNARNQEDGLPPPNDPPPAKSMPAPAALKNTNKKRTTRKQNNDETRRQQKLKMIPSTCSSSHCNGSKSILWSN